MALQSLLVALCLLTLSKSSAVVHPTSFEAHSTYQALAADPTATSLDFEAFRTRVQPILLNRRKGHARCYACHAQGTPFRLQPLAPGSSSWSEEESRRNFEAVQRVVVPGAPLRSRLLTMPLAAEAGGTDFHPGGKHWASQDDPEWQLLADWVRAKR